MGLFNCFLFTNNELEFASQGNTKLINHKIENALTRSELYSKE